VRRTAGFLLWYHGGTESVFVINTMAEISNFDLVNIWKRQRRRVPRVPADLEVWTWFRARVLDNPELRERFKKEGLDSFLVFCQLQWADYF